MKQGVVIHHNGPVTNLAGKPHTACVAFWEGVRRYHVVTKGWSDIAYSFGVCHHGERLEGRGWDRNQAANGSDVVGMDDGKDSEWYSVFVFLGWNDDASNPVDEEPSPEMIEGVKALIAEGRATNRCGTRVLPHNAFKPKRCPGATFTRLAGEWNHSPLTQGDDMPLTPDEIETVAARCSAVLRRDILNEIRAVAKATDTRVVVIGQKLDASADVDEAAITAGVLAGLTPADIAAAIPGDLAEKVADELAARLSG